DGPISSVSIDSRDIQPEALYSLQGGTLKSAFTDYDTKLHYFAVPVLAKIELGPVFVEAGPQFSVLVDATKKGTWQVGTASGTASYTSGDTSVKGDFKSTDFSVCAGAGVKLGPYLAVGGRFVAGLHDINDVKTLTGINDPRLRNRVFQVYAAVQFGR
ncbi:MAG: PorT family protein, partial [Hymenobacter sp.]